MRIGLSLKLSEPKYNVLAQNIRALFADGSQGWWYDDNDTTTLFQDSAGTTPVTAVEQFVGLQLDKSKGLVLGPELVTNGDFSSAANWILTSTWAISGGSLVGNASTNSARQNNVTTAGKWYRVSFSYASTSGNQIRIANATGVALASFSVTSGTSGVAAGCFLATGTDVYIEAALATYTGTIDNFSVRELPGNHRYAPASGNRPIWSKRVNLFEKTEQFDDAYWTKSNGTVTANATTAPDGTLTADLFVPNTMSAVHRVLRSIPVVFTSGFTFSMYVKAGGYNFVALNEQAQTGSSSSIINLTDGSGASGSTTVTFAGNGWWRIVWSPNLSFGSPVFLTVVALPVSGVNPNSYAWAGDGTSGIYIWGADLRPTNQATGTMPLYQRVNTSTDYDTNGFPGYLKADGVDDFLQTNSINFTATDKVTLCAGVRKLSDAAQGIVAESSSTISNAGTFTISAPRTAAANFGFQSGGTLPVGAASGASFASPLTAVLTGVGNISSDTCLIRVNGTEAGSTATDQGTGNYGNYPAYFFRRGGTTLPFNGYEYGNIAVGKLLTADQLTALETYMNGLTKAY